MSIKNHIIRYQMYEVKKIDLHGRTKQVNCEEFSLRVQLTIFCVTWNVSADQGFTEFIIWRKLGETQIKVRVILSVKKGEYEGGGGSVEKKTRVKVEELDRGQPE